MTVDMKKIAASLALGTALATASPAAAQNGDAEIRIGMIDNGTSRNALKALKDPRMSVESRVMHNGVQAGWTGDSLYSHGDLVAINAATAARAISPNARIKVLAANVYMPSDRQDFQNIRFRMSYEAAHKAVEWFKEEGVKVVVFTGTGRDTQEMRDLAAHVRREGMTLVASTNNAPSREKVYPAAYSEVLGVAGTAETLQIDRSPELASYVSYVTDGRAMVGRTQLEVGSSFAAGTVAGYAAAWAASQKDPSQERLKAWLDSRATSMAHSGVAIPTLASPPSQAVLAASERDIGASVASAAPVPRAAATMVMMASMGSAGR